MSLPLPSDNQPYWDISALMAGQVNIPAHFMIANAPNPSEIIEAPALAFLLRSQFHPDVNMIFDLGIRKDLEGYPRPVFERSVQFFKAKVEQDALEAVEKGGLRADDITHICLSHCHWDHIGDPSKFPKAQIIVGGESRDLFNPGYPEDPKSWFASDLLPPERTIFLPPTSDASTLDTQVWKPLGPLPYAYDFFGDGSLYLVAAGPGHLPGHINALVRTSADGGWAYLGGDCAHDWRHITGEADIAEGSHRDTALAKEHISYVRKLREANPRLRVLLAHDKGWYENGEGEAAFWPGKVKSA
ncbi:Metallo-hydrolase/oxidoreductase [Gloeophyllum trabeum ATCC 11539]|uniref:Metallo-hydrolase/oxidoreductase n=1 Tax=Gloeophyllum trabeum (strain ATCC 11539 / FP-39264 / Madison 617) TaxID=670483 RepID=S7Q3E8_GLOTA|nr:Metallo-hydrolase/oxidoreductase [Gloeophyllum trabeum ATCC 11539]EPQ54496.1 Metallo-hydrolase/oxidoreductase [Gloeophyllum trabeum ATCC 11539]